MLTLGRRQTSRMPPLRIRATVEVSAFGSTACKALQRCTACEEPFENVKAI